MPIKYTARDLIRELAKVTIFSLAKIVPKQKNLWVFGAWKGGKYSDNSKYLFEYVSRNHPEIDVLWVTNNKLAHALVKQSGGKVAYFGSLRATWACMRAGVAITCVDAAHDLPSYTISAKTRRVQLWHGLGPKAYHLAKMSQRDLEAVGQMDIVSKIINKLVLLYAYLLTWRWYNGINWLPYNLMPSQDLVVTTSALGQQKMTQVFGGLAKQIEILGYPRHDHLMSGGHKQSGKSKRIKVLYAPTHRTESQGTGIKQVEELSEALKKYPQIELLVKLHDLAKDKVENVQLLSEGDIAQDICTLLPQIDVLITDYSSIYTDFITRSTIVFTPLTYTTDNTKDFYDTIPLHTQKPRAGKIQLA